MSEQLHEPHAGENAGEHAAHHGSPFIQHHYDDAQHQFDSGKLGIWLFLAQEVLFFSALFVAYTLYRYHHPEIYSYAHKYLDVKYGAINTAVLIFSSLTAAWAVRCAQLGQRRRLLACIAVTIVCACAFLGIKYIEYSHKVHEHILFGRYFDPCVSSGGRELLTRNNNCPGTKSTVVWDYGGGAATAGCFNDIDQDPHTEGVQADCAVKEYSLTETPRRVTQPKVDADGKPVVGADGKPVTEEVDKPEVVEHFTRDITEKCEEAPLPGEEPAHPEPAHAAKFPCWRPAYQPAVCKKAVGILVEYGDEEEREQVRIKAECKPPPKLADPGDLLANRDRPLQLGKPQIQPRHQLTVHELHELEAAGPPPEHTNMFLTIYFAMTGLHGIHVLFGVGVFTWLLIRAFKGHFTPDYFGPIDYAALYWHIVDLIWIFLFPLLYLIH
ncbi:MAG TPA: cytochrome c oxidase subunit 3 [Kofleriaceae bacterium]|jgi:cytochrome c oxidase subunit 3|nr:cytochrome c oxidase subunit 3 [Kofleriaceae bacterium]